jgi:restriction endonuclease Mrr
MSPLLQVAADGLPHRVREAAKDLADRLFLPANLRDEPLPDGRNKLIHRLEWASRQHIQQFVGALRGKRARKGVFITTSTFTQSARDYVNTIDNRVVLIDGDTLA